MIRGTTPTHTFTIPFDESVINSIKIIYAQNKETVFEKLKDDCTFEGNTVSLTLTQEETFKFDHKCPVEIQIRILTTKGNAIASEIRRVTVGELLDDEVLK